MAMPDYDDRDIYGAHGTSRPEILIGEILNKEGIPFIREYTYKDLQAVSSGKDLRFDFAVLDDAGDVYFLIEYQGEQHYMPKRGGKQKLFQQKFNDSMKRKYCMEHFIPLVEIPFQDLNRLDYDYIMNAAYNAGAV